ncbi:MAG: M42 family peptidase, partial [Oscillospiraceae bacterium]
MFKLICALCAAAGVSGDEQAAAEAAVRLLSPLGPCTLTPLGSVLCRPVPKRSGLPRVMLTAHLDQIGLMVTRITDKGF